LKKRTIRASEIGSYLFCKRAWWYQLQGEESENQQEMAGGSAYHRRHGQNVLQAIWIKAAAWIVLISAFVLFIVWLTGQALP
jgi:CRISPR/Cas system-associated exonuclease Cas4 (RecB family)